MSAGSANRTPKQADTDQSTQKIWAGGWYIFENDVVEGPVNATTAMAIARDPHRSHHAMISRSGFSQWYPVTQFPDILSSARAKTRVENANVPILEHTPPKLVANAIGPDRSHQRSGTKAQALTTTTLNLPSHKPEHSERKQKKIEAQRTKKFERLASEQSAIKAEAEVHAQRQSRVSANLLAGRSFDEQYLLVASRLRLGKIRSPIVRAWISLPISLGIYWKTWLREAREELQWHHGGEILQSYPLPMWMSLIPPFHFVFAWRLASLVAETERKNGYRNVTAVEGAILAICPPLYIWRIQAAMNRHWTLHVHYSALNQASLNVQSED